MVILPKSVVRYEGKSVTLQRNNTNYFKDMRKLLTTTALLWCATVLLAQNIDFDLPGKTAPGKDTEINYISWAVPRAQSDTKTFDNGMTITVSAGEGARRILMDL